MSGICGQFNLDSAPVAEADLRAMTAMLKKRGPEGTGVWQDGSVGVGHTLLATTPESQFEQQPFTHQGTGCVITSDVRLDNREELLAAFELFAREESIGDAELILLAYLEWGEDCVDRLLGDFAFAIWDPRHQIVFGARDHFGMRPFYYHNAAGKRFIFASDARAILVLPQVPYEINKGRIADFLVGQLEWIDYTSTFYEDIFRLPPGSKVTATLSAVNIAQYWRPKPISDPGPMSDDDYAEGFLDVFTEAVKSRLRAPTETVGSMLSGGMDSGSVVAIGKEILASQGDGPLPTYSAVQYRDSDCAESRAIYAALDMLSTDPTLIHQDALQTQFNGMIADIEEPFDGQFMFLRAIYHAASEQGRKVVLDGVGGDVVLAEGSYIMRLIREGKISLAMSNISGENKFWGGTTVASEVLRYSRAALVPEFIKKPLRRLMARGSIEALTKDTLISPEFAVQVDIEGRLDRMREIFPGAWTPDYATERCNAILPNLTAGRERYARIAAGAGVESRDPFMDKRLVDYCSRLPGRIRMKHGWPKMILRELMADRLPDAVRWMRGKPHIGWMFNAAVTQQALSRGELDHDGLQQRLQGYVDPTALANAWQAFQNGVDAEPVHTAYLLSQWLRNTENRPVVPDRRFR